MLTAQWHCPFLTTGTKTVPTNRTCFNAGEKLKYGGSWFQLEVRNSNLSLIEYKFTCLPRQYRDYLSKNYLSCGRNPATLFVYRSALGLPLYTMFQNKKSFIEQLENAEFLNVDEMIESIEGEGPDIESLMNVVKNES